MLTYNVGATTSYGKKFEFKIQIDEYNNFSQEVVDIINCILHSDYDVKEVNYIDFVCEEDKEDA